MILVTLGTQNKIFTRLLDAIQKQIEIGNINEEVIVQAGYTKYDSKDMKIFDFIPNNELENYVKECNILITHGGVASILSGLRNNKKIIAAARLHKYNEHINDHQLEIIDKFAEAKYLLKLDDFEKLDNLLLEIKTFVPSKYVSNTQNFIEKLQNYFDNN